ncbi:MAG: sigma-70 family RNA polymerase sigma factor [Verrucomicrobia bacterium]|nr:MAG: sigma-70 family RNA polymerase sigma factor [Verrucomicrobiota bacterium]
MPQNSERPATIPAGGAQFPPTLWSVVLLAGQNASEQSHEALATLCRAYWFPLYAFLRRQGKSPPDAEDLTQGFMLHLLEKETLSRVKRERGKFRSFLLASLQYYLADERSKQMAQKRGGGATMIALDAQQAEQLYQAELTDNLDPAKVFDRRWSLTLIERALSRLEAEYSEPGRKERFQELKIFLLGEPRTISCAEAGQRLGIREGAVKVAVLRLRQRFGELLRAEIASTVATPEEVEDELRHLFATLAV